MGQFLFRFGYTTPAQWDANEAHGWDDESSAAFLIEARSAADALEWGRALADAFVAHLFERSGRRSPTTWTEAKFAHWIEEDPRRAFSEDALRAIPAVRMGEMPDWDRVPSS